MTAARSASTTAIRTSISLFPTTLLCL